MCIIRQHVDANGIFAIFQSACLSMYNCETAILRIQDDILLSVGNKKSVLLVSLDLSAAFDTVDHQLRINQRNRFVSLDLSAAVRLP